MVLYLRQKKYFEQAYRSGEHGWPVDEPSSFVLRFLKEKRLRNGSGRVLDMGCGEGRHTFLFASRGWEAFGMDFEPLALKRAKEIAEKKGFRKKFHFVTGDVFHLPFPPNCFDAVLDYGVLHHIRRNDTPTYLKAVVPTLKQGGYFLLSCSTRFKHHPRERRQRPWLVHRGHYDRFFKKSDFKEIFGSRFSVMRIEEEKEGCYAFYHVLMRKDKNA